MRPSTGPVVERGIAVTSRGRTRHGFFSRVGALAAGLTMLAVVVAPSAAAFSPTRGATFTPGQGPVGSVITVSARLTQSERRTLSHVNYLTAYIARGHPHAGLETVLRGQLTIASDGAMRLTVRVPLHADWRANPMSGSTDRLAETPAPTVLELAWPCRACGLGAFQLTAATLPFTGRNERAMLELAVVLLASGAAATALGTRRPSRTTRSHAV